ncbi:hypothetical protein V8E53_015807 [Lactarius tabidus]
MIRGPLARVETSALPLLRPMFSLLTKDLSSSLEDITQLQILGESVKGRGTIGSGLKYRYFTHNTYAKVRGISGPRLPICTFTAFWSPVALASLRLAIICNEVCNHLPARCIYAYVRPYPIGAPQSGSGSTLLHVEFCPFRHEFSAPRIATLSVLQLRRDYDKHLYLYALHARANHNSRTRLNGFECSMSGRFRASNPSSWPAIPFKPIKTQANTVGWFVSLLPFGCKGRAMIRGVADQPLTGQR